MGLLERLTGRKDRPAVDPQDAAEKLLADSFRLLGDLCKKLADLVEAQRLERRGYERPGRFLERIEPTEGDPKRTP